MRYVTDSGHTTAETHLLYLKGARQRHEWISDGQSNSSITQCDERRRLLLNEKAQLYAYEPIEDVTAHVERLHAAAVSQPRAKRGAPS